MLRDAEGQRDAKSSREEGAGRAENQKAVDVATLAGEMHTTGEGSSVAAMVATAARHGLKLQGISLTAKGLAKQKLPIVALIAPGHYVLVEAVTPLGVTTWDPDAHGTGAAGRRTYSEAEWGKAWSGVALR